MSRGTTPSQTVGPYLGIGLPWPDGPEVVDRDAPGVIRIHGHMLDGAGDPVPDGMVETWQADPDGRFDHPDDPRGRATSGFRGFGRACTDEEGAWEIFTLKPGPVPGPGGTIQAPHIDVSVLARGLLNRVVTRIYFGDEEAANAADPLLSGIADAAARATLIARPEDGGYRFDVHLQGPDETVFFAI
jgi:protocatechuate 3,4-dioxygenase, alpha subunit